MLTFIKALIMAAVVCSGPVCSVRRLNFNDPRKATIVRQEVDPWRPNGYKYAFQTSFGISRSETGYLKTASNGRRVLVTEGEFSYFGTDRKLYQVNYVADENGYQPTLGRIPQTRLSLLPSADYADDTDDFLFPDDESNIILTTTTTSTSKPPITRPPTSSSTKVPAAIPLLPSSTAPTIIDPATPDVTAPTVGSNSTNSNDTLLDDRFLPPGVIGSLLGR